MLTVEVSPASGGTVKVGEVTQTAPQGQYTFASGQVIELTAIPKPGYAFTGWDGASIEKTPTISIEMSCTKNLTAAFTQLKYHIATTVLYPAMGEVKLDPVQPQDGYAAGTVVYLHATAFSGYTFKGWSGGASGNNPSTSIIVDSARAVTAEFAVKPAGGNNLAWGLTAVGVAVIAIAVYMVRFSKH